MKSLFAGLGLLAITAAVIMADTFLTVLGKGR